MAFIDQEIRRLLGKAINHYGLIEAGDRIAVAVSGGKDSMLLLWLLRERLRRIPIKYDLVAVHLDPGFGGDTVDLLESYFVREGFRYEIIRTDFGVRAHGPENRENPCFLCARLRRSALFRKARELGCSKIAFGHNQDDLIETFWINICYGAQVAAMVPRQEFFGGEITVIRPLALMSVPSIIRMCKRLELPVLASNCPSAEKNKRAELRRMLEALYKKNPKVRGNIYHAMSNINLEYLPPGLPARGKRGDGKREGEDGKSWRNDIQPAGGKCGDGGRTRDLIWQRDKKKEFRTKMGNQRERHPGTDAPLWHGLPTVPLRPAEGLRLPTGPEMSWRPSVESMTRSGDRAITRGLVICANETTTQ